ncbi:MAG: GNAT family N-acetyltransferase [Candidatus Bipolaricaulia bacterium]
MIEYRTPTPEERDTFLEWMREHMADTIDAVMAFMDLTWEGFSELFGTVGEVRAIYDGDTLAGLLWIEHRERVLHIHGIILRPEFRGRGIGTGILESLENEFAGEVDVLELGVRTSNEGAIRFYKRVGFEIAKPIEKIGFLVLCKPLA